MGRLAGSMKERIEGELTYPGTIDVTVIRRVVAEVTARSAKPSPRPEQSLGRCRSGPFHLPRRRAPATTRADTAAGALIDQLRSIGTGEREGALRVQAGQRPRKPVRRGGSWMRIQSLET